MHTAKRAIIMAAGIGKRMQPITLETPKPLVLVNGTRMIETIIDGLHENGIYEIYIVVGYMKEKFEILKNLYSGITLLENDNYDSSNNISSLYVAKEYIKEAIIIDGDQLICNNNILNPKFERSGYCAAWVKNTDEWLLTVENDKVTDCSRTGGKNGYQLYSVSFWTENDGQQLKKHLEYEFDINKNKDIYWDDVALFCHFKDYQLGIRKIKKTDLIEIDSFEELVLIDSSYKKEEKEEI